MIYNMYALYDKVSETFDSPVFCGSDKEYDRQLLVAIDDVIRSGKPLGFVLANADDFDCYQIGTYNAATGEVSPITPIRFYSRLSDYLPPKSTLESRAVARAAEVRDDGFQIRLGEEAPAEFQEKKE